MNVPVVSKEYVLTGVLRQKLEPEVFAMSELRDIKTKTKMRNEPQSSSQQADKMVEKRKSRSNIKQEAKSDMLVETVRRRSSTPKLAVSTRTRKIRTPAKYADDV